MYSESPPPDSLRRLVRCRWESAEPGPKRIVPDGCVDLVAGAGQVFVAGPDTTAWTSAFPPGTRLRGLRFRPGAAAAMLGVGADELRDSRVPLPDLWNRRGATLADEILSGRDLADAMADVAAERTAAADPVVERMLAHLAAEFAGNAGELGRGEGEAPSARWLADGRPAGPPTHPGARLSSNAAEPSAWRSAAPGRQPARHPTGDQAAQPPANACRSERQARRRFTLAVGYGPATYRRILRLHRAIALAPAAATLADLAVAAGYADQPHLIRECRALTGLTPGAYFAG
ncbi:AraC family transcriptional regulator [Amycolatopsis rubida]|uniref:AraC family transcriptional regulator n=1 Tax=Amycolatopsis rubida TaxID=112413 RepID=A0ABX0BR81_9PSEU|nr:helix-turn-helix domain-containing protein [Amycolatopsis sp. M39]MYW91622.1 helix-turn-helix domain-containing protein [Amycolatopsis rubida]NEC56607.1 AraC family transcriptional regulator [Amycolatopsis rubida]OAP25579.1 Helix-turn-helix domain protein [Amycolatopsis sp. M39]